LKDQKDDEHCVGCSVGERKCGGFGTGAATYIDFWSTTRADSPVDCCGPHFDILVNQSCSNPRILRVVVGCGGLDEIRFDLRRHRA
jgi:hypothetical protein